MIRLYNFYVLKAFSYTCVWVRADACPSKKQSFLNMITEGQMLTTFTDPGLGSSYYFYYIFINRSKSLAKEGQRQA